MSKPTYAQFAKEKVKWSTLEHRIIDVPKPKSNYVPKIIPEELFLSMVRERDMLWISEGKFVEFLKERHKI